MARMTWSVVLKDCVYAGFTYKKKHYEWDDIDCLYYSDISDEDYFTKVPENAIVDMY
jgi:hypothetical protein